MKNLRLWMTLDHYHTYSRHNLQESHGAGVAREVGPGLIVQLRRAVFSQGENDLKILGEREIQIEFFAPVNLSHCDR